MPVQTNAPELGAAIVRELRVKGDYRLQLDETISPVVVIGRLEGGSAASWPRNLSTDWRAAARWLNISTNPAIWYRFNAPAGSAKAARITRLALAMNTSSTGWVAVFRGDMQATLGGAAGTRQPGRFLDNTGVNPGGVQVADYGLQPMTGTGAPLNFSGAPLAIIRQIGAQRTLELETGIDCAAGEILSIVPLNTTKPGSDVEWRFEALVSTYALGVEWLEEY